jgi:hypothetical protein
MGHRISGLIALGLTLVFVGIVWMIFRGFLDNIIIPKYWISNTYLNIMGMEFNAIPTIILLVGMLVTIIGAAKS